MSSDTIIPDPSIMPQAVADRIRAILSAEKALDPIKAFVRGGAPPAGGFSLELYPFMEVFVFTEEQVSQLTGRIHQMNYEGILTITLQHDDQVEQEKQGDRFYAVPSYDQIKLLAHETVRILNRQKNSNLQGLATQYGGLSEVVTDFELSGLVEYGLDFRERTNNFDNFAVIPFVVMTNRQEELE